MGFREYITEDYGSSDDVMFADGLDDAIIGFEPSLWKVVYSRTKCVDICVKDGMDEEEAREYFEYNIRGAYMGEMTPLFYEPLYTELQ